MLGLILTSMALASVIVVVDETSCLTTAEVVAAVPALGDDSQLLVRVVGDIVIVVVDVPGAGVVSRTVPLDRSACAAQPPIIARIVERHLEGVPVASRAVAVGAGAVEPGGVEPGDVEPGGEPIVTTPTRRSHVGIGAQLLASTMPGAAGFTRVSALPQVRWRYDLFDVGAHAFSLGLDGGVRVGMIVPVAVGSGHVAGGDVVVRGLVRARWSLLSVAAGVEGGVLALQGRGFLDDATAYGPTINAVVGVGITVGSVVIDLGATLPALPAVAQVTTTRETLQVAEGALATSIGIGAIVPVW